MESNNVNKKKKTGKKALALPHSSQSRPMGTMLWAYAMGTAYGRMSYACVSHLLFGLFVFDLAQVALGLCPLDAHLDRVEHLALLLGGLFADGVVFVQPVLVELALTDRTLGHVGVRRRRTGRRRLKTTSGRRISWVTAMDASR